MECCYQDELGVVGMMRSTGKSGVDGKERRRGEERRFSVLIWRSGEESVSAWDLVLVWSSGDPVNLSPVKLSPHDQNGVRGACPTRAFLPEDGVGKGMKDLTSQLKLSK